MQHCPNCGAEELKIIAAILRRPVIERLLTHRGLDPLPPPKGRAHDGLVPRKPAGWRQLTPTQAIRHCALALLRHRLRVEIPNSAQRQTR